MISNLGWGTFLLWGIFDTVIAILSFFFLKETKGLSLEAIAHQQFNREISGEDAILTKHVNAADHQPVG